MTQFSFSAMVKSTHLGVAGCHHFRIWLSPDVRQCLISGVGWNQMTRLSNFLPYLCRGPLWCGNGTLVPVSRKGSVLCDYQANSLRLSAWHCLFDRRARDIVPLTLWASSISRLTHRPSTPRQWVYVKVTPSKVQSPSLKCPPLYFINWDVQLKRPFCRIHT